MIRLFTSKCCHEFSMCNIKFTNIPLIPEPLGRGYFEWKEYYAKVYKQEGITKRVSCVCNKCGKVFYADCGLHLNGKLVR